MKSNKKGVIKFFVNMGLDIIFHVFLLRELFERLKKSLVFRRLILQKVNLNYIWKGKDGENSGI